MAALQADFGPLFAMDSLINSAHVATLPLFHAAEVPCIQESPNVEETLCKIQQQQHAYDSSVRAVLQQQQLAAIAAATNQQQQQQRDVVVARARALVNLYYSNLPASLRVAFHRRSEVAAVLADLELLEQHLTDHIERQQLHELREALQLACMRSTEEEAFAGGPAQATLLALQEDAAATASRDSAANNNHLSGGGGIVNAAVVEAPCKVGGGLTKLANTAGNVVAAAESNGNISSSSSSERSGRGLQSSGCSRRGRGRYIEDLSDSSFSKSVPPAPHDALKSGFLRKTNALCSSGDINGTKESGNSEKNILRCTLSSLRASKQENQILGLLSDGKAAEVIPHLETSSAAGVLEDEDEPKFNASENRRPDKILTVRPRRRSQWKDVVLTRKKTHLPFVSKLEPVYKSGDGYYSAAAETAPTEKAISRDGRISCSSSSSRTFTKEEPQIVAVDSHILDTRRNGTKVGTDVLTATSAGNNETFMEKDKTQRTKKQKIAQPVSKKLQGRQQIVDPKQKHIVERKARRRTVRAATSPRSRHMSFSHMFAWSAALAARRAALMKEAATAATMAEGEEKPRYRLNKPSSAASDGSKLHAQAVSDCSFGPVVCDDSSTKPLSAVGDNADVSGVQAGRPELQLAVVADSEEEDSHNQRHADKFKDVCSSGGSNSKYYIERCASKNRSREIADSDEMQLERHAAPTLGDVPLKAVQPAWIKEPHQERQQRQQPRIKKERAKKQTSSFGSVKTLFENSTKWLPWRRRSEVQLKQEKKRWEKTRALSLPPDAEETATAAAAAAAATAVVPPSHPVFGHLHDATVSTVPLLLPSSQKLLEITAASVKEGTLRNTEDLLGLPPSTVTPERAALAAAKEGEIVHAVIEGGLGVLRETVQQEAAASAPAARVAACLDPALDSDQQKKLLETAAAAAENVVHSERQLTTAAVEAAKAARPAAVVLRPFVAAVGGDKVMTFPEKRQTITAEEISATAAFPLLATSSAGRPSFPEASKNYAVAAPVAGSHFFKEAAASEELPLPSAAIDMNGIAFGDKPIRTEKAGLQCFSRTVQPDTVATPSNTSGAATAAGVAEQAGVGGEPFRTLRTRGRRNYMRIHNNQHHGPTREEADEAPAMVLRAVERNRDIKTPAAAASGSQWTLLSMRAESGDSSLSRTLARKAKTQLSDVTEAQPIITNYSSSPRAVFAADLSTSTAPAGSFAFTSNAARSVSPSAAPAVATHPVERKGSVYSAFLSWINLWGRGKRGGE